MLLLTDQEADNTDSEAGEEKEGSVVIDRVITSHPQLKTAAPGRPDGGKGGLEFCPQMALGGE